MLGYKSNPSFGEHTRFPSGALGEHFACCFLCSWINTSWTFLFRGVSSILTLTSCWELLHAHSTVFRVAALLLVWCFLRKSCFSVWWELKLVRKDKALTTNTARNTSEDRKSGNEDTPREMAAHLLRTWCCNTTHRLGILDVYTYSIYIFLPNKYSKQSWLFYVDKSLKSLRLVQPWACEKLYCSKRGGVI